MTLLIDRGECRFHLVPVCGAKWPVEGMDSKRMAN